MLILVRLLSPAEYGTAALAQGIVGLASVISFSTFSGHTVQARNPDEIDWQAHFTAATAINVTLALLVLALAYMLSFTTKYADVALPLAGLAAVLIVEIPGTLRARMLETAHDWKRYRILLIIGTLLGLSFGLVIGLMGGGVWALVIQVPMLGLPAAIDLLVVQRFRPDWTWSWPRWRETYYFGIDRIGAGIVGRGRLLNEQTLLSSVYDLGTLGIFGRTTGLAMLITGRIGSVAMMSLTPVITRADAGSARFQRLAELSLRGVVWATLPLSALLALTARDIVALLYGARWENVANLMPLAALAIGLGGILTALSSLLMANNDSRGSMFLDIAAGLSGILIAIALIPIGAWTYLAGLGAHAIILTGAALLLLQRRRAITMRGIATAFLPALASVTVGVTTALIVRHSIGTSDMLIARLFIDTLVFSLTYVLVLRLAFARPLAELLAVAPGGARIAGVLKLEAVN
jgi:O-antigen/teichoic acid export membrane protein